MQCRSGVLFSLVGSHSVPALSFGLLCIWSLTSYLDTYHLYSHWPVTHIHTYVRVYVSYLQCRHAHGGVYMPGNINHRLSYMLHGMC